jgi:hypothetical protein
VTAREQKGTSKSARRGRGPLVLSAFLLAAVTAGGCGSGGDAGVVPSSHSFLFDESRGAFRGIALRDPERRIIERFGPDRGKPEGPVTPLGADAFADGPPGTFASTPSKPSPHDRTVALRYRGMSFITNNRRVYVIMSSLRGTRTLHGVEVGDALDEARTAYRGLTCRNASDAHGVDMFPYCNGRLGRGRFIYFGGDPVGTIAVARVPLYGG